MLRKGLAKAAVALGNFLFHYRNMLFPVYVLTLLIFARPVLFQTGSRTETILWEAAGLFLTIMGEGIRLSTIGFRYIERGGKNRRVYASSLVTEGIFGHVRNPMYIGNILVVAGLSALTGSPVAFGISVVVFAVIYRLIVAAEEDFLHRTFGTDFEVYCRSVNRFWPRLRGLRATLAGMPFEWKRTLRKDYGNIAMIALSLTVLPLWRRFFEETGNRFIYFQEGHVLHERMETAGFYAALILVIYFIVWSMKKQGKLADSNPSASGHR